MIQNCFFNPLRLHADITLGSGGGAVLQKPLHQGNVITTVFVNLRSIPFAEAVSADPLEAQIIADDFQLLLDGSFGQRKNPLVAAEAVPQAIVFDVLLDHQRHRENAALPGLLLHNFKAVSVSVQNDVTEAELHNVADPQAKVSLQHKGRRNTLIGAAAAKALLHSLDNLFVLLRGESLCLLVHSRLQKQKVRKIRQSSSFICGIRLISA